MEAPTKLCRGFFVIFGMLYSLIMGLISFIGTPEILIILLVVLLLFGSKQIPEFARMLGKGLREFRKATDDIKKEINEESKDFKDNINDINKTLKS